MRLKDSPASEIMGSTWFLHHCQARPRPPKGLTNRSNRGGLGSSSGVISAKRGEGVYRGHRPRSLTSEGDSANSPQWRAGTAACWELPAGYCISPGLPSAQPRPPLPGAQTKAGLGRLIPVPFEPTGGRREESCRFNFLYPQTPGTQDPVTPLCKAPSLLPVGPPPSQQNPGRPRKPPQMWTFERLPSWAN